ncbi:MAG TPA: hypothetical protein VLH12_08510 [Usitatibacter sp.]|nr:hypothetical protein [Usitatibacter sp.]
MTPRDLRNWAWSKLYGKLGRGRSVYTTRDTIPHSFVRVASIGRTRGLRRALYAPPPFRPQWLRAITNNAGGLWGCLWRARGGFPYQCPAQGRAPE